MDVRRIAVVDNDRVYLGVIRDLLEDEGFAVLTHDDLASGCAFLKQQRPELAIVDILQQREPLGLTLLAGLRQDPELRGLPVIVVSADELLLRERAGDLQAAGFGLLPKPFDFQELLALITRTLAHAAPSLTTAAAAD
jgi:DNA-binding response OmpR family regulator